MSNLEFMEVSVVGIGSCLPEAELTNEALIALSGIDSDPDWITKRTGVESRHVVDPDEFERPTGMMAFLALRQAVGFAEIEYGEIDRIIVATSSGDTRIPAVGSFVSQQVLKQIRIESPKVEAHAPGAFDVNAACAGFAYAAELGYYIPQPGITAVIGAETFTRFVDPADRSTSILFGDGAGAMLLKRELVPRRPDGSGLLASHAETLDEETAAILKVELGETIEMEGRQVFEQAITSDPYSVEKVLEKAGCTTEDVKLFVPHQANRKITDSIARRVGFKKEQIVSTVEHTGNTSAASIPIALNEAIRAGRAQKGDLVLMSGFGAGMTVCTILVRL